MCVCDSCFLFVSVAKASEMWRAERRIVFIFNNDAVHFKFTMYFYSTVSQSNVCVCVCVYNMQMNL